MPSRIDLTPAQTHVIVLMAEVGVVVIHHVAKESVEVTKATGERMIVGRQPQMPLADAGSLVAER